jgi:hypothetical protein
MRLVLNATALVMVILGSLNGAAQAAAQQPATASGSRTGVVFYTENDDWPPDTGSDRDYTSGFRLTIDRTSDSSGCIASGRSGP